jgi:hypothetical protein
MKRPLTRGNFLGSKPEGVEWETEGGEQEPVPQHIVERQRERAPSAGGQLREPRESDTPTETPIIRDSRVGE